MTATINPWPVAIFGVSLLRDLDARARREIAAAGSISRFAAGQYVYRASDASDALFVVVDGEVEVRDEGGLVVNRARSLDVLGHDAIVRVSSRRRRSAVCVTAATIARVPADVLARGLGRLGISVASDPRWSAIGRAAIADAIRSAPFAGRLSSFDLGALTGASQIVTVARGRAVYRSGEPATHAYFVAEGAVSPGEGEYVGSGALFGHELALARKARASDATALSSTWLLSIPRDVIESVALRNTGVFSAAVEPKMREPRNAHRLQTARSLLVIDQDACVRCGHCVSSCASAHDDGLPRFTRLGDVVMLPLGAASTPALLASSCHHCERAACVAECPTGAIERQPGGEVTIREDLCTGCGACVKACAWGNVSLVTKAARVVASKCDLCATRAAGPACVAACPVGAASRIDPSQLSEARERHAHEVAAAASASKDRAVVVATLLGSLATFASLTQASARASGAALAASSVVAASYVAVKRARLCFALKPAYRLHLVMGAVTLAAAAGHLRPRLAPGLNGALAIAVAGTLVTGAAGWAAFATIPRALTRIEPDVATGDDDAERSVIARSLLAALTGQSLALKTCFRDGLHRYAVAPLGWLALVLSRRTIAQERARIHAAAVASPGDIAGAAQGPLTELVRHSVSLRAMPARRALGGLLSAWLPVHVAFAVACSLLALLHVITELVYR